MDKTKLKELEDSIRNASPLDLANKLQQAELYDKQATNEVVEEVYQEFSKQGSFEHEILVPVFMSFLDGIFNAYPAIRKKGLSASNIITQCQEFDYECSESSYEIPNGYVEFKNIKEQTEADFNDFGTNVRQQYDRSTYEDKGRLNQYKEDKYANNGGRINATDEYTNEKNIYQYQSNPDGRRNIEKYKHDHQAEVDHIVPLKKIHEQFKGNYALTDEDIKNIANNDTNYAMTSARNNRGVGAPDAGGKFEKTNTEFVEEQRRREKEGRPHLGLSEEAKNNMLQMEKDAQKSLEKDANKTIVANLAGRGTGNSSNIWSKSAGNAANQAKDYVVGNVILYLIKPLYYEISDIFKNGLVEGVSADSSKEALKIRFGRMKGYVLNNALAFLGDNVWEFVKGFVSSLIEGIISLFIGVFKQILKVIKEGIKIFTKAGKVLFSKDSGQLSPAQKGDAIIKIIGGSVIAICSIGIEALLNKLGLSEKKAIIVSTMLAGIASTIFMLLLDRLDLFSVKAEKRRERIEDIFNERINDIHEAEQTLNKAAMEAMRQHQLQFIQIEKNINEGIQSNDIAIINTGIFELAKFMNIDLGYSNLPEFVIQFDDMEIAL